MPRKDQEMKRFLLFSFDDYYPRGGWNDLRGSFDALQAAIDAAMAMPTDDFNVQECQIVDLQTGIVVGRYRSQSDGSRAEAEINH
jgi:hypothetical protein